MTNSLPFSEPHFLSVECPRTHPIGVSGEVKSLTQGLWLLTEEALNQAAVLAARPSSTTAGSVALSQSLNLSEPPLAPLKACSPPHERRCFRGPAGPDGECRSGRGRAYSAPAQDIFRGVGEDTDPLSPDLTFKGKLGIHLFFFFF